MLPSGARPPIVILGWFMRIGIQQHVAAAAKAYMAYDIENGRDFNDSILDEQTLGSQMTAPVRWLFAAGEPAAPF